MAGKVLIQGGTLAVEKGTVGWFQEQSELRSRLELRNENPFPGAALEETREGGKMTNTEFAAGDRRS